MYTSTRKNTFTLVTLQSFSISGAISAEKMRVENWEIYKRLYDALYPSHTNVCKFFNFQLTFFSADITPEMLKLCRVTKVKVFFPVLVYVFNFDLFEFSAAILEKGLLPAGAGTSFFLEADYLFHNMPKNNHNQTARLICLYLWLRGVRSGW